MEPAILVSMKNRQSQLRCIQEEAEADLPSEVVFKLHPLRQLKFYLWSTKSSGGKEEGQDLEHPLEVNVGNAVWEAAKWKL